jgi:hypothetical protein
MNFLKYSIMDQKDLEVLRTNTEGRAPHISRRQREQERERARRRAERIRRRANVQSRNGGWTGNYSTSFFPLTPLKFYDFTTNFFLIKFPQSSVQAVLHFAKVIAPPSGETSENPFEMRLNPEQVKVLASGFYENIRARWAFRKLLGLYRAKKSKLINTEDPITLEPFTDPIQIYYTKPNVVYQFEPKSLMRHWSSNLLENDGFFPAPRFPTNPYTNLPLSLVQVHSALKLLRRKHRTDWLLESFSKCSYNLEQFKSVYDTPLLLSALEKVFADEESYDRMEMVIDFVRMQFENEGMGYPKKLFSWIFRNDEVEEYGQKWVKATKKYLKAKYLARTKDDIEHLEISTAMECEWLLQIPTEVRVKYSFYLEELRNARRCCLSNQQSGGGSSTEAERS